MDTKFELKEDSDFIEEPTLHNFIRHGNLQKELLNNSMIKSVLNIEKMARDAGILEDEDY